MPDSFQYKVLYVEDEEFTRSLVASGLTRLGADVVACATVAQALTALDNFEPHVVVADLDLGMGPSGAFLLARVAEVMPWVGTVILTSHASPELAARDTDLIPEGTVYLVKSRVASVDEVLEVAQEAIERRVLRTVDEEGERVVLSKTHTEILRLMADGLSNAGIAKERNTTVKAAEGMVQRTLLAMGIRANPDHNARVLAVRMWQQGKVIGR